MKFLIFCGYWCLIPVLIQRRGQLRKKKKKKQFYRYIVLNFQVVENIINIRTKTEKFPKPFDSCADVKKTDIDLCVSECQNKSYHIN